MAQMNGINIERLQGGLQRMAEGTDNHLGYIVNGIPAGAVATAVNNGGKGVVLTSTFDAEELGINENFDTSNNLAVYDQISEFFRLAPEATLYLFNSSSAADLTTFINHNPEIKGYAIAQTHNSQTPNQVSTLVNAQQLIVNTLAEENRFIDFVLLGVDDLNDFSLDLYGLQCPQVSVVVACEKKDGMVSLGSALGMIAVRKISENLGSVDIELKPRTKRGSSDYPLTDETSNRWMDAYLTDEKTIASLDKAQLNAIVNKGYIIAAGYQGYAGFFFNNSGTATDRNSDYAYIENNRVWNKAVRIIRATLLPRVKSKVKKDPATGFIASTTAAYWQTLLEKALDRMIADDDISGREVIINPKQVVNDTSPVKVQARIVADGVVHEFTVAVGLTNSI
ncbi:DUF2586 family protein [Sphingobacterium spiritivorum]